MYCYETTEKYQLVGLPQHHFEQFSLVILRTGSRYTPMLTGRVLPKVSPDQLHFVSLHELMYGVRVL